MGLRLHDFYNMPLNELLIALHAWGNKRDREIFDSQFIAYHAMIGSHLDPNKIPSFNKFINAEEPAKRLSEEAKQAFLREHEEYLKIKEGIGNEFRSGDTGRH